MFICALTFQEKNYKLSVSTITYFYSHLFYNTVPEFIHCIGWSNGKP